MRKKASKASPPQRLASHNSHSLLSQLKVLTPPLPIPPGSGPINIIPRRAQGVKLLQAPVLRHPLRRRAAAGNEHAGIDDAVAGLGVGGRDDHVGFGAEGLDGLDGVLAAVLGRAGVLVGGRGCEGGEGEEVEELHFCCCCWWLGGLVKRCWYVGFGSRVEVLDVLMDMYWGDNMGMCMDMLTSSAT